MTPIHVWRDYLDEQRWTCAVTRFTDHLGHLTVVDTDGRILLSEQVTLPTSDILISEDHTGLWLTMCQMAVEYYNMDMMEGTG